MRELPGPERDKKRPPFSDEKGDTIIRLFQDYLLSTR